MPFRQMRAPLLLALLAPSPLTAQQPPSAGIYRIFQGPGEVGRETFQRTDSTFEQTSVIPMLNLRIESRNARDPAGRFRRMTLTLRTGGADTLLGTYRADRAPEGSDSVRITSDLPRAPAPHSRALNFDLVLPPQSVATLAELIMRAGGRDTTWRLLIAGSDSVVPAVVRFHDDSAHIRFGGIEIHAVDSGGRVVSLDIPAQRARAVYVSPTESLPPLPGGPRPAPNYAAPPDAPYTAEEVRVPVQPAAGDTFSLGCTLTLPKAGRRPFPAAVTITGSGLQPRDEELWPTVPGYRPFRQIAERLARAGIATLRCDDRGKDASTGDPTTATTADLADDTRAQIAWLRARPGIDPSRIALAGHSEGGIIGPMVAANDARIRAVVILAGPSKRGVDILVDQARWPVLREEGLTPEQRASRLAAADSAVRADSLAPGEWFRWFYRYDPLPTARQVRQPVLILHGALDRQVSAGQADTLAAAIRRGGNRDVTVKVFPGLNHLFLPSPTDGSPSEYASLKEVQVPAAVSDGIAVWLAARFRR
jgi:dienelactone hydrolase